MLSKVTEDHIRSWYKLANDAAKLVFLRNLFPDILSRESENPNMIRNALTVKAKELMDRSAENLQGM